jgi:hypothetical protein
MVVKAHEKSEARAPLYVEYLRMEFLFHVAH